MQNKSLQQIIYEIHNSIMEKAYNRLIDMGFKIPADMLQLTADDPNGEIFLHELINTAIIYAKKKNTKKQ